jgi:hypothetical protein
LPQPLCERLDCVLCGREKGAACCRIGDAVARQANCGVG